MSAETRSPSNGRTSALLLESWLRQRLGSRVPEVTVESDNGQLIVCGRVNTYYALVVTEVGESVQASTSRAIRRAVSALKRRVKQRRDRKAAGRNRPQPTNDFVEANRE